MKTSKRALEALKGSIVKWNKIITGAGVDTGPDNCPLCMLYFPACDKCPICIETDEMCCDLTPYVAWEGHLKERYPRNVFDSKSLRLARAERDWLEALYKKLVRRNKQKARGK